MIAAILCPGPSLLQMWSDSCRPGYGLTLAINTALRVTDCDIFVAGDIGVFQNMPATVRPGRGIFTTRDTADFLMPDQSWGVVNIWQELALFCEHRDIGKPLNWSVQAALCHAAELGATHIDLYGCDGGKNGRADCTGYLGENRGPDRWEREEADLAVTLGLLRAKGVSVNRI